MKYEDMLKMIDGYLNAPGTINKKWHDIMITSKRLIQKELNKKEANKKDSN